MSREADRVLAIYPGLLRPVWQANIHGWMEAAAHLDDWVKDLLGCLGGKSLDEIRIYPCNGSYIQLTSRSLRRLWKRQLSVVLQFDQEA